MISYTAYLSYIEEAAGCATAEDFMGKTAFAEQADKELRRKACEVIFAAAHEDIGSLVGSSSGRAFAIKYSIPDRNVNGWLNGSRKATRYSTLLLGYAVLGNALEEDSAKTCERRQDISKNDFEIKKKLVLSGKSRIFKEWKEHSSITEADFIEALEWLCADPLDEKGRMTREIGLSPTGIVRLSRGYGKEGLCTFHHEGSLWDGEFFTTPCRTEKEKLFSMDGKTLKTLCKITLSCRDRV